MRLSESQFQTRNLVSRRNFVPQGQNFTKKGIETILTFPRQRDQKKKKLFSSALQCDTEFTSSNSRYQKSIVERESGEKGEKEAKFIKIMSD
jgi:hypothetical protein